MKTIKIIDLLNEKEKLQQENQHLQDLQKSMDKQYEELENENNFLKANNIHIRRIRDNLLIEYNELQDKLDKILSIINTDVTLKNETITSLKRYYSKRDEEIRNIILGGKNE